MGRSDRSSRPIPHHSVRSTGSGHHYPRHIAKVIPGEDATERYLAAVQQGGGRLTSARRAIIDAFLASGGHVTAEGLVDAVRDEQPDIAVSTVYRTMDVLESAGLVEHLHLGHGPAVYHLAEHDHRHLVCQDCDRVIDIDRDEFAELVTLVRRRFGFVLDARHFALPGRCAECASRD